MELQFDTRNHRDQEVRIGRDEREVAAFRKAGRLIQNIQGTFEGAEHEMKLAAPWNGFRYQLLQGGNELASAKRRQRMHAFDPERPLIRHVLLEFELDVGGRAYRLTPGDRYGLTFVLLEVEDECGRLAVWEFERQKEGPWEGELQVPEGWSVPLAAFLAWLARESRRKMNRR